MLLFVILSRMAKSSLRASKKSSGGRYVDGRKKKLRELARDPTNSKIGEKKVRTMRVRGGQIKKISLQGDLINVYNPSSKKYEKVKIKTMIENSANRHFIRRNILTKGAVVETDIGKVKVTSRPGQEGSLNGVLLS